MSQYSKTKRKCGLCFNFWTISNIIVKALPCFQITFLYSILLFILPTDLLSIIPLRTSPKCFLRINLDMLPHRCYDTNWIVSLKKCFMEISKLDSKHYMISMTYKKSTFFFKPSSFNCYRFLLLPAQIPVHYLSLNAESQAAVSADAHCTVLLPRFFLSRGIIPQEDPGADKHDAGVSRFIDTKTTIMTSRWIQESLSWNRVQWPRPGKTGSGFCKSHVPTY